MKRARGFTVLELVVALVIAAIITGAISSSLSQLGRAREVARLRMTASRRATDALEQIRRDIQSVVRTDDLFYARLRLAPETVGSSLGELDRDQLLLFNTRLRPMRPLSYSGEGQEYETQYRIEADAEGTSLWRRRDAAPDEYEDAGGIAEPVGEGVLSLRLEAYDGSSWRQDWDSDVDGLPWAVRATVTANGARLGDDAPLDPRSLVTLQSEIPIDRIEPPKSDAPAEPEEGAAEAADPTGEATGGTGTTGGSTTQTTTGGGFVTGPGASQGGGGFSSGKGGGRPASGGWRPGTGGPINPPTGSRGGSGGRGGGGPS